MADVSDYEIMLNGAMTTVQLTEEDAKRLGVKRTGAKDEADAAAGEVANRAKATDDKARRTAR